MMYNPYSLSGKKILVTGASSGIGRSTAIECSKLGARVIITARNEERLKETLAEMPGDGHEMIIADLSSNEDIDSLVMQLPELDGVVNNAGFTKMRPILQINEQVFKDIMQVNTFAPILLTQKILKKKKLKKCHCIMQTFLRQGLNLFPIPIVKHQKENKLLPMPPLLAYPIVQADTMLYLPQSVLQTAYCRS